MFKMVWMNYFRVENQHFWSFPEIFLNMSELAPDGTYLRMGKNDSLNF